MEVLFYLSVFAVLAVVIPWMFLYAIPVLLAIGYAGWGVLEYFGSLLIHETPERRREKSPLDAMDVFPYTRTRADLRRAMRIANSRRRAREEHNNKKTAAAAS